MRDRLQAFFAGRQGMDELSKALFWVSLGAFVLGAVTARFLGGFLAGLLVWLSLFAVVISFVRALSRRLEDRERENRLYLTWLAGKRRAVESAKARRAQKDFRFFKCPGCGSYLRVPKGKGKIHIRCKCGYTLYRRT